MSDPLQDIITELGDTLKDMTGLVRWYDDPPEALAEFPCGWAFCSSGSITPMSNGWSVGIHTITINIYHSRQILPKAVDEAKVWPYRVITALAADIDLNGKVETLIAEPPMLRYRFGQLQYGTDIHYGCTFDITVKVIDTLTVG